MRGGQPGLWEPGRWEPELWEPWVLWDPPPAGAAAGSAVSGWPRARTGTVPLPTDPDSVRRFHANCAPPDDAGHVWWLGAIDGDQAGNGGYGRLRVGRGGHAVITTAHRYSWTITRGRVPVGLVVRHRCDEQLCVADTDLELGTPADNHWDTILRPVRAASLDVRGSAGRSRAIRRAVRTVLASGCTDPVVVGAAARAAMARGDPGRDQLSFPCFSSPVRTGNDGIRW